jgi:Lar family restriction alleviation protein
MELKACPFCGGKAELIKRATPDLIDNIVDCYFVICTNKECECLTQYSMTPEKAVTAWNRRSS